MRTKTKKIFHVGALFALAIQSIAQGTFQNLDFELANPIPLVGSPDYPYAIANSNAMPGWTAYIGSNPRDSIYYNTVSYGAALISLHDSSSPYWPPIQGSNSLILFAQFNPNNQPGRDSAAVAQTGQIPDGSLSIRFYSGSEYMQASFNGQDIPLIQLGLTGSYLILGGDISAFGGQTGELRFTMPSVAFSYNIPYLDNILFSPQPIPEPGMLGLFALSALLVGWRLREKGNGVT